MIFIKQIYHVFIDIVTTGDYILQKY